jgi:PPOX class probable F420-dependent enzyme
MLSSRNGVAQALDMALIGFLTAVDSSGQPQTSPVWFLRVDEDLIVYNRPESPRLTSIASNPLVAMTLRADRRGSGLLTMEGRASLDPDLPPAHQIEAYLDKYAEDIERLGWTPAQFASLYSVPLRIEVTRVRAWEIEDVIAAESA